MNRQTSPSELTGAAIDCDVFIIECRAKDGSHIIPERDLSRCSRSDVIRDILECQEDNVRRIYAFNVFEGWSRDVSEDIAIDVLTKIANEHLGLSAEVQDFLEQHLSLDDVRSLYLQAAE